MLGRRKTTQPARPASRRPGMAPPYHPGYAATGRTEHEVLDGALPSPEAQETMKPALRTAVRKARHRGRHGLLPLTTLATLPAAAEILHAAGTGAEGAAIGAGACSACALLTGAKLARSRPGWVYAGACAALSGGWMAWGTIEGVSRPVAAALVLGWLAAVIPWWNRHRSRHGHIPAGDAPPELPPADEMLERLRERICGTGGPLAGASVVPLPPVQGGRAFLLRLVPGKQTVATATNAAAQIASAAEAPLSRVVVEATEGDTPGERGPEHLAKLTVLGARSVMHEIQEFDGPTLDRSTGLFVVGPYPDGTPAWARLYKTDEHGNPIRAASGIASGAPGSGKSRYAEHKILEHLTSGLFKVFLLDGQGGASIPGLIEHVDWPALRPAEWQMCLRAAVRLMIARTRRQASRRMPYWAATPEEPFIQIVIEEAHKPLRDPVNLLAVKALTQEGEKVGIGVDLSTQFPSQIELGGASGTHGANALRDLVTAGNVTLFRTGGKFAKAHTVGEVEVSPHLLPQRPGMCFVLGASMRTSPVRAIRAADPAAWTRVLPQTWLSELDVAALDGSEHAYTERWQRFAAADAEVDAKSLDMATLNAEVELMLGLASAGVPSAPERQSKRTAVQEVWDLLCEHGSMKRADMIGALGQYSGSSIDQALGALERTGKVRKGSGHGVWELAATPMAAASQ